MLSRRTFGDGLALGAASLLLGPRVASATTRCQLFRIARSKNKNIVEYAARLAGDASLEQEEPIEAYWQMLAEDGHREPLTWSERRLAYGFATSHLRRDGCQLALVACPKREISIVRVKERYFAHTSIAGKPSRLASIFVRADDTAWLPRVEYIELGGVTLTGELVRERLHP